MKPPRLNLYGDQRRLLNPGFGADIQSQRLDALDQAALDHLNELLNDGRLSPLCMDLGCGHGTLGAIMAERGGKCIAIDRLPLSKRRTATPRVHKQLMHLEADLLNLDQTLRALPLHDRIEIAVCQRVIHYFPFASARSFLCQLYRWMHPKARLYLGVSGLLSELGRGYPGRHVVLEERFSPLDPAMQEVHGIEAPVCLYDPDELEHLLGASGFVCQQIDASPFGNLKVIAVPQATS